MGKKVRVFRPDRATRADGKESHRRLPASRVSDGTDERGRTGRRISASTPRGQPLLRADRRSTSRLERQASSTAQLAIVLDGQVRRRRRCNSAISQPTARSPATSRSKEVDDLVQHPPRRRPAGHAEAATRSARTPWAPTLGEDTINTGTLSVGLAFAAVLIFMLVYYRFAGLVACVALLANLLLTVAFMVLVNATFTLPGLAGLVLMLGMAVDANVLIYERLREERDRGASLALAIRNGYDRAFPTIIDTHLTQHLHGHRALRGRQRSAQGLRHQPDGRPDHQPVHVAVHDADDVRHLAGQGLAAQAEHASCSCSSGRTSTSWPSATTGSRPRSS